MPPKEYVKRMIETGKVHNPKKEDIKILMEDGTEESSTAFKVWSNEGHKFYGWECNLGVDRLVIQADGSIAGSCSVRYIFNQPEPFNLFDPEFATKFTADVITPTICKEVFCSGCSSDIELVKRKVNV